MRYIFKILAMLSDIVVLGIYILCLLELPILLAIPITYFGYQAWQANGGLIAWTHYKDFFKEC